MSRPPRDQHRAPAAPGQARLADGRPGASDGTPLAAGVAPGGTAATTAAAAPGAANPISTTAQQLFAAAGRAPGDPANTGSHTTHRYTPGTAGPATLAQAFQAALQRGVHGLCFSPYLPGQQPGSAISEAQIESRLKLIQPHTRWVRSFSCTDGHEQTPRIAHALGLQTLVGAWLGTDEAINERELQGLIDVARAGHADLVAVGNEVLLREDLPEDVLLAHIERVKAALPGVPVGYVDAYYLFEDHPRITAACEVVLSNCYPFWEGCAREHAMAYLQSLLARTRAAAPGKRVIVSETGWPAQGSAFQGAVPSVAGAMQYFVDTCQWAESEGIELFYFSAFDEAWKVGAEGDVGACWGLWDQDGTPKFR